MTDFAQWCQDAAIDVFSTVFRNKDKLDAIKVVLVSEILLFLNTDMEHFGLQEKIRAIQVDATIRQTLNGK
jgi:hypothetical protein